MLGRNDLLTWHNIEFTHSEGKMEFLFHFQPPNDFLHNYYKLLFLIKFIINLPPITLWVILSLISTICLKNEKSVLDQNWISITLSWILGVNQLAKPAPRVGLNHQTLDLRVCFLLKSQVRNLSVLGALSATLSLIGSNSYRALLRL